MLTQRIKKNWENVSACMSHQTKTNASICNLCLCFSCHFFLHVHFSCHFFLHVHLSGIYSQKLNKPSSKMGYSSVEDSLDCSQVPTVPYLLQHLLSASKCLPQEHQLYHLDDVYIHLSFLWSTGKCRNINKIIINLTLDLVFVMRQQMCQNLKL